MFCFRKQSSHALEPKRMERSREVDGKLTGGKRSAIASRVTVATEKFQHFVGEIARLRAVELQRV